VFRPTGFADLVDKRVGVFGYGVEGRAAVARLGTTSDVVIVDDAPDLAAASSRVRTVGSTRCSPATSS